MLLEISNERHQPPGRSAARQPGRIARAGVTRAW